TYSSRRRSCSCGRGSSSSCSYGCCCGSRRGSGSACSRCGRRRCERGRRCWGRRWRTRSGWAGCSRGRGCATARWEDAHEIDVLLVLTTAWIEVEGGRIRDIASCVIRHDCDVVTYLVLV